jgi:hypothetical protein
MASASAGRGLRRATGGLFVAGAIALAAAALVLSSTFNWPDILREPASMVLPAFADGGTSLVWTWFATAWAYAILAVPILLCRRCSGGAMTRRCGWHLRGRRLGGAVADRVPALGVRRPAAGPLLRHRRCHHPGSGGRRVDRPASVRRRAARRAPGSAARYRLVGHPLRDHRAHQGLPRWLGVTGLAVSALYLLNQGDILATAVPGLPVWDLAGLIGSTGWGLWVAALGVTVLLRPAPPPLRRPAAATRPATAGPRG